ncbi:hypothetical protein Ahy_B09g099081 isoform B [Arachis hypogaea]|uniref:Uncharacterized protein n=1 Tax=Arachis hypogaea TaxID=3818 RepID=A0A444XSX4_ARAHY|nr:hypothetical protein Ahy_B09g099081 isoform B [Arachis hypogaea]
MDAASIEDEEDLESVLEEQEIKTSIYDKPIKAVALMDTGSCATVLKPHVLLKEIWAPFSKRFTVANSEVFTINLISKKPIGLEIFASQTTWLRVLGSYLPDKDVLFGFDAFFRTHGLHIKPTDLSYKGQFLPFTGIQSILEIQEAWCTNCESHFSQHVPLTSKCTGSSK